MASGQRSRPGRSLLLLGLVLIAMFGIVALLGRWSPALGLDLEGGTRITLQARASQGSGQVTPTKMNEAVGIIQQRVNGSGVSEAAVTSEGGNQIIVEIPGQQRGDLAARIGETAQLRFRLVNQGPQPAPPGSKPGASPAPQPPGPSGPQNLHGSQLLQWKPSPALQQRYDNYVCPPPGRRAQGLVDDASEGLVACDRGENKYLLSPAIIEGTDLTNAAAVIPQGGVQWVVDLSFNGQASDVFADVTRAINGTGRQFAIVLDGQVLSAPVVSNGPILSGQAQISGNFSQQSATALANSLKYGALPLSFDLQGIEELGPELAGDQLSAGLLAGVIGLALVVAYSLLYYRALGLVVVTSLMVAAASVYACVLLLGQTMNFTLTLPGVAGLIVAIGITADSFIVFFERLRDEVREGKSLRTSVETGWHRARRTILAADAVTFIAAVVLYIFAVSDVKGFAFALGLTTLIDVAVVFLFTKPLLTVLARTKFFGSGHRLSGLDPHHLGVTKIPGQTRAPTHRPRRPRVGEA